MTLNERKSRIRARGEHSGHSHIITGEALVINEFGEVLIDVLGNCAVEHLLEDAWMNGEKVHTKEHAAIELTEMPAYVRQGDIFLEKVGERTYRFIQQQVYDPLSKRIEAARD
jgi:hypothetical protein